MPPSHAKRIEVPIDHRIGREDRRFDFQEAAGVEELPQPAEQVGPHRKFVQFAVGRKSSSMVWLLVISFESVRVFRGLPFVSVPHGDSGLSVYFHLAGRCRTKPSGLVT